MELSCIHTSHFLGVSGLVFVIGTVGILSESTTHDSPAYVFRIDVIGCEFELYHLLSAS